MLQNVLTFFNSNNQFERPI